MKRRSEKLYRKLAKSAMIDIRLLHGDGPFMTGAYYSSDGRFQLMDGDRYEGSVFFIETQNGRLVWAVRYPSDYNHGFQWSFEQVEDFIFTHWKRRLRIGEP